MIKLSPKKIIRINDDKKTKEESDLIHWLSQEIELSDDFTLEDLFWFVKKEKDIFNTVFYSHLGGYDLQKYINDIEKNISPKKIDREVKYLEIKWIAEYYPQKDINSFDMYISFHGVNKEGSGLAIGLSSLNEMKHLPIKINNTIEIYELNDKGETLILKSDKDFTVYDFLMCIFYEISFYGDPTNKKQIIKELDNIKEEDCEELTKEDIEKL